MSSTANNWQFWNAERPHPLRRFKKAGERVFSGIGRNIKGKVNERNMQYQREMSLDADSTKPNEAAGVLDDLPAKPEELTVIDIESILHDLAPSKGDGSNSFNYQAQILLHENREDAIRILATLASPKNFSSLDNEDKERAEAARDVLKALVDNSKQYPANNKLFGIIDLNNNVMRNEEVYDYSPEEILGSDPNSVEYFERIHDFVDKRVRDDIRYFDDFAKNTEKQFKRVEKQLNSNFYAKNGFLGKGVRANHAAGLGTVMADEMRFSLGRIFTDHAFRKGLESQPGGQEVLSKIFKKIGTGLAQNVPVEGLRSRHYTAFIKKAQKLLETASSDPSFDSASQDLIDSVRDNAEAIQKLELDVLEARQIYRENKTDRNYNTLQELKDNLETMKREINGFYNSFNEGLVAFGDDINVKELFYEKLFGESDNPDDRQKALSKFLGIDKIHTELSVIQPAEVKANTPLTGVGQMKGFALTGVRDDYQKAKTKATEAKQTYDNLISSANQQEYLRNINSSISAGSPVILAGNNIIEQNYNALVSEKVTQLNEITTFTHAPSPSGNTPVINSIDLNTIDGINEAVVKIEKHIREYENDPDENSRAANGDNLERYRKLKSTLVAYSNWDEVTGLRLQISGSQAALAEFQLQKDGQSQVHRARDAYETSQAELEQYEDYNFVQSKLKEHADKYFNGDPDLGLTGFNLQIGKFVIAMEPSQEQFDNLQFDLETIADNQYTAAGDFLDNISEVIVKFINQFILNMFGSGSQEA